MSPRPDARYPLEPLAEKLGVTLGHVGQAAERNLGWLARWAGVSHRTAFRWRADGIRESDLDRLAVAAGVTPRDLWPEWLPEGDTPHECPDCPECFAAPGGLVAHQVRRHRHPWRLCRSCGSAFCRLRPRHWLCPTCEVAGVELRSA